MTQKITKWGHKFIDSGLAGPHVCPFFAGLQKYTSHFILDFLLEFWINSPRRPVYVQIHLGTAGKHLREKPWCSLPEQCIRFVLFLHMPDHSFPSTRCLLTFHISTCSPTLSCLYPTIKVLPSAVTSCWKLISYCCLHLRQSSLSLSPSYIAVGPLC